MSSTGLVAGAVVGGDFQIVRPLSSGGMGAVFVAKQLSTERERALKVMLLELSGNEDLKRRFVQEAKIGAQIESEHVVEVVAAGIDPTSGAPWLAMELLQGQDLAAFLQARGALPPAMVLELFEQLTHALGAAHDKQIVHRDLKPENLFLAQTRRAGEKFMVKVLDFGIAKLMGQARTKATGAMGTPLWMAPEQTQPGAHVTPAADVWAMGLIAFRALAGRSFWKSAAHEDASAMMVMREMVFEALPTASERARELGAAALPPGFDAWFARCVCREPSGRYQHARDMQRELARVLSGGAGATTIGAPSSAAFEPGTAHPAATSPAAASLAASNTIAAAPLGGKAMVAVDPTSSARTDLGSAGTRPVEAPRAGRSRLPLVAAGVALTAALGIGAYAVSRTKSQGEAGAATSPQAASTSDAAARGSARPSQAATSATGSASGGVALAGEAQIALGKQQHEALCASCHSTDGAALGAPTFQGLIGRTSLLEGGSSVVVDDNYIRESIVTPGKKVVAGYPNTQPAFPDLKAAEVDAILAYLKSLPPAAPTPAPAASGPGPAAGPAVGAPTSTPTAAGTGMSSSRDVTTMSDSELRLMRAQCTQSGDRACRDRAAVELARRSPPKPPPDDPDAPKNPYR